MTDSASYWKPAATEQPFPGLLCNWFYDREIIVYQPDLVALNDIDRWADIVGNHLKNWPEDQPYLALHDISNPKIGLAYLTMVKYDVFNIGITSTGWEYVKQIIESRPSFTARIALLFSLSQSGHLIQTLTYQRKHNVSHLNIEYEAFFSQRDAFDWLSNAPQ